MNRSYTAPFNTENMLTKRISRHHAAGAEKPYVWGTDLELSATEPSGGGAGALGLRGIALGGV
jgi:hypothetical protein